MRLIVQWELLNPSILVLVHFDTDTHYTFEKYNYKSEINICKIHTFACSARAVKM